MLWRQMTWEPTQRENLVYSPSMPLPRLFDSERLGWRNIPSYRWFPFLDKTPSHPCFYINFIPSGLRGLTQMETLMSWIPLHIRGREGGEAWSTQAPTIWRQAGFSLCEHGTGRAKQFLPASFLWWGNFSARGYFTGRISREGKQNIPRSWFMVVFTLTSCLHMKLFHAIRQVTAPLSPVSNIITQ